MPSDLIELIVLAIGAGFLIFKLYTTLGQRTGFEPSREMSAESGKIFENAADAPAQPSTDISEIAIPSYLKPIIDKIRLVEPQFNLKTFLKGATEAFEIILEAFAKGDLVSLKNLSGSSVYEDFKSNIEEREKQGEVHDTTLIKVESVEVTDAEIKDQTARLIVTYRTEQIHVTRDLAGKILDGNPKQIEQLIDTWTFERTLTDRNPNWTLIKTVG